MSGKIYVIGTGPGDEKYMTPQAKEAIIGADVVVGYDLYVELIAPLCAGKKIITTGMKKEVERCALALDEALNGATVAFVCSGDAGVYGMAGIMYEVADGKDVDIEVIPGITAATSAAAALGAPLIHDFAVISLSDLLTPWDKIEKRILCASEADFVICLYNPRSKKRVEHLSKAIQCMLKFKSSETHCGYVKHIGRAGETVTVCTLDELEGQDIDMFTTIIIGNSQTKIIDGKLVTPRGYKL